MNATDDFTACARVTDDLIEQATKEQLADAARLLALSNGWYQERYGDVAPGRLWLTATP